MRKTDRKLEQQIIRQLTLVCETAKAEYPGFIWLTHTVNYQQFPQSLKVTLVFSQDVSDNTVLTELQTLVPMVQSALEPVLGELLPAKQIEARQEHTLQ